ncbi:50S ribosomal protein L11 methyltransferase [Sulfobacillus thermosulfidooxidans]|uniref:50S ribosomal protein L11 methyltransferase n=1 Tax=Sulfobacillus thermosulfidooxidans TaxID=28034 RepID=UPI0006B52A21|nr:50S ribosomal protein L11 methyltransferase [Sulfobacillus thermosulfidooxidans]
MPWVGNSSVSPDYMAVTCFVSADDVEWAAQLLLDFGLSGIEWEDGKPAQAPFTDIPLIPGRPFVRGYFPDEPGFDNIRVELEHLAKQHGWDMTLERIRTEDWANNWKQYYHPIYLKDNYVVVPAWQDVDGIDDDHRIILDPAMAFGTGTHPTTLMCLNEIIEIDPNRLRVLDLGAGSGILAIIAGKMHAHEIWAVEPDPVAFRALESNIALNHLKIHTLLGTLKDVPHDQVFDLALCNLIADIIIPEWPSLIQHLHPGSQAILSGILWERREEIIRVVESYGGHITKMVERDGWAMMVATP